MDSTDNINNPSNNLQNPDEPLVSIIVITYNSARYVLETLESAKAQTYQNIELIISDDCSIDNTVSICQDWIEINPSRFGGIKLITSEKNTGIAANCNRGISAAGGEWIKLIAGDDIMLPTCIMDNIDFIRLNHDSRIVLSNMLVLKDGFIHKFKKPVGIRLLENSVGAENQYKTLLDQYFGNAPTIFVFKEVFVKIKFDETQRLIEDYAFALNATRGGFCFSYLDKDTIIYRMVNDSISHKGSNKLINDFYLIKHEFDKKYRFPFLPEKTKRKEEREFKRIEYLNKFNLNRNTFLCRIINRITFFINSFSLT